MYYVNVPNRLSRKNILQRTKFQLSLNSGKLAIVNRNINWKVNADLLNILNAETLLFSDMMHSKRAIDDDDDLCVLGRLTVWAVQRAKHMVKRMLADVTKKVQEMPI